MEVLELLIIFAIACWPIALISVIVIAIIKTSPNPKEEVEKERLRKLHESRILNFLDSEIINSKDIDVDKVFKYLNSNKTCSNYIEKYVDKLEFDFNIALKNQDYIRLKKYDNLFSSFLPFIYKKYKNKITIADELQKLCKCKECLIYDSTKNVINIERINELKNYDSKNLIQMSLQETLWYETLRKSFNKYSYESIRDAIYNNISSKVSMELYLSEEYVTNRQSSNIERKIEEKNVINIMDENEKTIFKKCMSYINESTNNETYWSSYFNHKEV